MSKRLSITFILIGRVFKTNVVSDRWAVTMNGITLQFILNYNDNSPSDIIHAHKLATQEIVGINSIITSNTSNLHTILTSVVDFMGFRVICYPELGSITLLQETLSENPRVLENISPTLEIIASNLNLKRHAIMLKNDRRVTVPLSSSIQIHSSSNALIITCLNEIFPLDYTNPERTLQQLQFTSKPIQHRRLRPEFLKAYPHSLCSDALTENSAYNNTERHENDREVVRASRFLQEVYIPAFVKKIDGFEMRWYDEDSFRSVLRGCGINIRYIGMIYKLSVIPCVKEVCLVSIISRCFKEVFRDKMRSSLLGFKSVGATNIENQMKDFAVQFFNLCLGKGDKSIRFLNDRLKGVAQRKFEFSIEVDMFVGVHRPLLFKALQLQVGYY